MLQTLTNCARISHRTPTYLSLLLLAFVTLFSTVACAESETPPVATEDAAASDSGARLATVPGQDGDAQGTQLPPGHPAVDPNTPAGIIPPPPEGSGTGANALAWAVPEGWQEVPPSSSMRRAQYKVPGPGGDAELAVFYFGPGQGGAPLANAERWAGQFTGPDGGPAPMETKETTVGAAKVLTVEVTGTYSGGMSMMGAPSQSLENYMLLGAIAEGPDANWFFKFTGPKDTLEAERGAFEKMIESLRTGG